MLIRRPSGYSYRRKVPPSLRKVIGKSEIWVSLVTNSKIIANSRICDIHSLTNELFIRLRLMHDEFKEVLNQSKCLTKDVAKNGVAIQQMILENDKITKKLSINLEEELAQECNDDLRDFIGEAYKPFFNNIIEYYETKVLEVKTQYKTANARYLLCMVLQDKNFSELMELATKTTRFLTNLLHKYKFALDNQKDTSVLEKEMSEILSLFNTMQSQLNNQAPVSSSLFSEASEVFITASSTNWKDSVFRGYRNSIKRFIECCGDKEIHLYTGLDVGNFKELMEKLPANYGRNPKDERTVKQLIEDANTNNLERVSGKSVKNHFSRLSTIWSYYTQRDIVEKNIFSGWRFDSKQKTKRISWSDEYLKILIEASFDIKSSTSKETYGYIVGVASYTGMRLEEICRIRVEDIKCIHNVTCINICEHEPLDKKPETAWNPKTEAGERIVPISQKLIDAGFLGYIKKAQDKKEYYIFSDLTFSGKDNKRSALFQRNFSKHKTKLGIPESTVFHSFRHNISTQLRNIPEYGDSGLREVWIDSFLGHEGNSKSVGNSVYLDAINIQNLKKVADTIKYSDFWDIRKLMK
ncbi:hypothetical protein HK18_10875 [Commensalibacter intestini]|uniref:Tyr recombinase domain-containing protein n=2 Tax=Commensalibacter intestini TaxID=479936 RepID=A0A251ZTQ2_9PROT|nr:hypothetical protein HK18_10875 [Commensalibacter intestini]